MTPLLLSGSDVVLKFYSILKYEKDHFSIYIPSNFFKLLHHVVFLFCFSVGNSYVHPAQTACMDNILKEIKQGFPKRASLRNSFRE